MIDYEFNDYNTLGQDAYNYIKEAQDALVEKFKLSSYTGFQLNQEKSLFFFSGGENADIEADFTIVGSFFEGDGSWLWGWANENFPDKSIEKMVYVAKYFEEKGIQKFITPSWKDTELLEGQELMAVSAFLLQAEGFYHIPSSDGLHVFLLLFNVHHQDEN